MDERDLRRGAQRARAGKTEKKKFSLKGFGGKKKKRWLKILIIL